MFGVQDEARLKINLMANHLEILCGVIRQNLEVSMKSTCKIQRMLINSYHYGLTELTSNELITCVIKHNTNFTNMFVLSLFLN